MLGCLEISAVIMAMGIFYGGIAQVIAGCMEFKKGNTFGTIAFTSYGLFWLNACVPYLFQWEIRFARNPVGIYGLLSLFVGAVHIFNVDRHLEGQPGASGGLFDANHPVLDACGA